MPFKCLLKQASCFLKQESYKFNVFHLIVICLLWCLLYHTKLSLKICCADPGVWIFFIYVRRLTYSTHIANTFCLCVLLTTLWNLPKTATHYNFICTQVIFHLMSYEIFMNNPAPPTPPLTSPGKKKTNKIENWDVVAVNLVLCEWCRSN